MALTKVTTGVIADSAVTTTQITDATIVTADIAASTIATSNMAVDPTNASNLSSGSVPLAQLGNVPADTGLQADIALLAFKTQANGSLARYNLVDQSVDAFESAAGVDASASTNETYDSTSKFYSGTAYGAYTVVGHTTVQTANWTVPASVYTVEALIVAGGGSGGANHYAGGGGAGGIVHHASYTVIPAAVLSYTVGAGGPNITAPTYAAGDDGDDSVFDGMTAIGGGGSAGGSGTTPAKQGGSGGGGANGGSTGATSNQPAVAGASVYGNSGGNRCNPAGDCMQGGGGGAGAVGADGSSASADYPNTTTGAGGVGKLFVGFEAYGTDSSNVASTGSNGGWFAGGGGGAYQAPKLANLVAAGGIGGGGPSGTSNPVNSVGPIAALANTGGGGGGWSYGGPGSSAGGSGFVGLRYRTEVFNAMTLVSVAVTAVTAPTKGDIVLTYTNAIGTATINTDLIASISMDNGSTYTDITNLASQGTTGGHTILTANDVTLTSTSGTSMRWKVRTLNQSATKSTVIRAVSLGWS